MNLIMMEAIFWFNALFIMYTYFGYPVMLSFAAILKIRDVNKREQKPMVSVVIAARNEENTIKGRIEDIFHQKYPHDRLEIIVSSDGSNDKTNEIVSSYPDSRVKLVFSEINFGKAEALNRALIVAKGEVVVFTDARQRFRGDAIQQLVANFSDLSVGCVSGELLLLQDQESRINAEMGAYWSYEKWIRKKESKTGSVVGATGAIYSIKRNLFRPLPQGMLLDDVMIPLNVVMQGFRVIFDSEAIAYDIVSKDVKLEWKRKVRTLAGNWQLLSLCPVLLSPFRNPVWWRFLSHKIFRLIVPAALLIIFAAGLLQDAFFYKVITLVQLSFYAVGIAGVFIPAMRQIRIVNMIYFFLVMNFAAIVGFWRWITGRSETAWSLSKAVSNEGKI